VQWRVVKVTVEAGARGAWISAAVAAAAQCMT